MSTPGSQASIHGSVELLEDATGATEDFRDGLAGAGEVDAGGVDHRGERVIRSEFGVGRAERDRSGDRGTEADAAGR